MNDSINTPASSLEEISPINQSFIDLNDQLGRLELSMGLLENRLMQLIVPSTTKDEMNKKEATIANTPSSHRQVINEITNRIRMINSKINLLLNTLEV